jgi:predicted nucleic acid-binding protein
MTTYLLDVSVLMALLWETHVHNRRVTAWQAGRQLAVCPITEIGFLRISTQPNFGLSVADARKALKDWKAVRHPHFFPCDLEALDTDPPATGTHTTDFYLASLAAKHGMELATLDEGIKHKAAFVIPASMEHPPSQPSAA